LQQQENAQDINAEVDAQREIAKLGYEEARLLDVKAAYENATKTTSSEPPSINLNRSNEPDS
jgi:hypothetical protein